MQRANLKLLNLVSRRCCSTTANYSYENLSVSQPSDHVLHVELNRPKKLNSITKGLLLDLINCFDAIKEDSNCRAVVLSGKGKMFCAGIDINSLLGLGLEMESVSDAARKTKMIYSFIKTFQDIFLSPVNCPKPIICAIHSGCIGGGTSIAAGADIRYCSADAWLQVKEVEVGLAADIGILQRLTKAVGNDSLARELAFTARRFEAVEAQQLGFVSKIFNSQEELIEGALSTAKLIAGKSPVAVQTTKEAMNYSIAHSMAEGLEYQALRNSVNLQSDDLKASIMAMMSKESPSFEKY